MLHTITALVVNRPGVLARVCGLFARRGFNIESLAVSITDMPSISRMTIIAQGEDIALEQIVKQLHKLIDVIRVIDYDDIPLVQRELAFFKVNADAQNRSEILQIVDIFRAKVIDICDKTFIIEVTGGVEKIDAFEEQLGPFGIREMVRTGRIAMMRGARTA